MLAMHGSAVTRRSKPHVCLALRQAWHFEIFGQILLETLAEAGGQARTNDVPDPESQPQHSIPRASLSESGLLLTAEKKPLHLEVS